MPSMTADQIIDYTARTEGGRPKKVHDGRSGPNAPYDAWNPDDTGAGVSFGCIQFNQAGGRLAGKPGSPLALMFQTSAKMFPAKWTAIMGPYANKLTDTAWVKQANLNDPDIKARILATARDPDFQRAQREQARIEYFIPATKIAKDFGVKSARGLAMLFDACVQMGPVGARRAMTNARASLGPVARPVSGLGAAPAAPAVPEKALLTAFASTADKQAGGGTTRRTAMLADQNLSDEILEAVSEAVKKVGNGGALLIGLGISVGLYFLAKRA